MKFVWEPTLLHLGWCITKIYKFYKWWRREKGAMAKSYITEHKLSLWSATSSGAAVLKQFSSRKSQSRFILWLAVEAWIGFQITWRPSVSLQARLSGIWSKLRPPGSFLNAGNSSPICSPWIRQVMSRNTYIVIHEGSF